MRGIIRYNRHVDTHDRTAAEEHRAARQRAGLFDLAHRGRLEITGPDRVRWLHRLLTNDITSLTPGRGCEAAFLTPQAKVLALLSVHALPDSLLLDGEASRIGPLAVTLSKYRISEHVEIQDRTPEFMLLALQGPQAPAILAAWAGEAEVPPRDLDHRSITAPEGPVLVIRNNAMGDPGFQILAPAASKAAVWGRLLAAGAPMGLVPCGPSAWESVRIEAGVPRDGVDVTDEVLLPETGLDRLVSTTKGCYLGQEFVVRIRDRGQVTRRLSRLALEGTAAAPAGALIRAGDRDVGAVTSSAFVPTQGRTLALGYVHRDAAQPGTVVTVMLPDGPCPAQVTGLAHAAGGGAAEIDVSSGSRGAVPNSPA